MQTSCSHAGTLVRDWEAPIAMRCSDPLKKAQSFRVLLLSGDACAVFYAESCPCPLCDINLHHIRCPNNLRANTEGKGTASCFPLSSRVSPGYFARVLFSPTLASAGSDVNKQRSHDSSRVSASGLTVVTQQQQLRWWGLRCDLVLQNHSTASVVSFRLVFCTLFSRACKKPYRSKESLFSVFGILGYFFEHIVANQRLKMCLSFF